MENLVEEKHSIKAIIKYAGAFIAWIVGSGFATGQEILLFFTSYGYASYGVVLLNLIGFLLLGKIMLTKGYEHKDSETFNPYKFYCGNKLGSLYSWLVPATLILIMAVLIAGAGATLYEYYGLNRLIGSAIMAVMVLCAYLVGFENLIKIVSKTGPLIIVFALFVGTITVVNDFSNIREVGTYQQTLVPLQTAPHWVISAVLYLSLSFLAGGTYYTALGRSAKSRKDAKWGAIIGALAVVSVIAIMNSAILLNVSNAALLDIPALYLARGISYALGTVFSIALVLGMFSSCSAMMWSFCNPFFPGTNKNKMIAVITAVVTFTIGLFPFQGLVGVVYPFIGYLGLIFIVCVIYKGFKKAPNSP